MHSNSTLWQTIAWLVVILVIAAFVWGSRDHWQPVLSGTASKTEEEVSPEHRHSEKPGKDSETVEVNQQARKNLGLESKPIKVQNFWRKIRIPGEIIDRPGVTDQGITSPLKGVVAQVHAFEGDVVLPGEKLFTVRLVGDSLQLAQSGLYQAIRETEILDKEKQRLESLIRAGIVAGKRRIELEQKASRQAALIDSREQELIARGLDPEQIQGIKKGKFLTTIDIKAPLEAEDSDGTLLEQSDPDLLDPQLKAFFEIKKLKVDIGYQIEAGAPLAILANHQSLYIKGHAFKKEASRLGVAAEDGWPLAIEFNDDMPADWQPLQQTFRIRHLSNSTDVNSRTFDFFVPLTNQSRVYKKAGRPFIVWRFRPGQRVQISIPVEEIKDVIVLPAAAVYQSGTEAFVFQQNGDLFNRIAVKIVHKDQSNIVIADDGSLQQGFYVAQSSAASLNRILKSHNSSGNLPAGFHVHADGTVHGAH